MVISHFDFKRFSDLMFAVSGIKFSDTKKYIVEKRVLSLMKEEGINDIDAFYALLAENRSSELSQRFIESLTTNETYFFREQNQLRCFVQDVLPRLIEKKGGFSLWSAGCSSGEEAYTLSIFIREAFPRTGFKILASDINRQVLDAAKAGVYSKRSLKNLPASLVEKYFTSSANGYMIKESLRKNISFRQLNLVNSFDMGKIRGQDVIFCRNVLIYFDEEHRNRILNYFYNALNTGGYLFLGHSETLGKKTMQFTPVKVGNNTFYQK